MNVNNEGPPHSSGMFQATIPPEVNTTSGRNDVSFSTSTPDVIFQSAVLLIGLVGTAANGIVVYIKTCYGKVKQSADSLILHQLVLDLFSCIALTITYAVKLFNIPLIGSIGYWLCILLLDDIFIWTGIHGSAFNLGAIAVERYLKICRPLWYKVNFRSWMIHGPIAFIWLSAVAVSLATAFATNELVDGQCFILSRWPSKSAFLAYTIWSSTSFYFLLVAIFAACYGAILAAIKHQQKVFHVAATAAALGESNQQKRMQLKILTTAVSLTLYFAVCWLPINVLLIVLAVQPAPSVSWYYGALFLGFFNISTNAFIYGAKSEHVTAYIRKPRHCCCQRTTSELQFQPTGLEWNQMPTGGGTRQSNVTSHTAVQRF